jgi:hypothetical protein
LLKPQGQSAWIILAAKPGYVFRILIFPLNPGSFKGEVFVDIGRLVVGHTFVAISRASF